jgi:hypothetical protein
VLDVSLNTGLQNLSCAGNQLTVIDLKNNIDIQRLEINDNQLSAIDVIPNTDLIRLEVYNNQINFLDVSANKNLERINCKENNLQNLNIKSGNNINLTFFNAENNPNLTCIEVDNPAYSGANWTNIDTQTSFSENCNTLSLEYNKLLDKFSIYPIPSEGMINIEISENTKYQLTNIKGQILKQGDLKFGRNNLNFKTLSKGIYFIKVKNKNTFKTRKVIIK